MCRIIELNINEHQPIKSWIGLFESLLTAAQVGEGWLVAVQPEPTKALKWTEWRRGPQWLAIPGPTNVPYILPLEWFVRMELVEEGGAAPQYQLQLTEAQESQIQRWIRVARFTEGFLRMHDEHWYVEHPKHGPGCVLQGLEVIHDQLGAAAYYVSLVTSYHEKKYVELGNECNEELFHDQNWLREWLFHTDWDFVQC